MLRVVLSFLVICFCTANNASASNRLYADNTLEPSEEFNYDWSLGSGLILEDPFLIGTKRYQNAVEWLNINFRASYGNAYIDIDRSQLSGGFIVGMSLIDKYDWGLDIVITQAQQGFGDKGFDLYHSDQIPELKGIAERGYDLNSGLRMTRRFGDEQVSLEFLQDVSSTHNGWIINYYYSKIIPWQNWEFRAAIGLNVYSDDFVDYYFGINSNEATATRPVYQPGSAYSVVLEFHGEYPINENWVFLCGWMSTQFSSDIYHSPIVAQNHHHKAKLGVRYVF